MLRHCSPRSLQWARKGVLHSLGRRLSSNPIVVGSLDHVCLCTRDMSKSISWYRSVLGLKHEYTDETNFYPRTLDSPAFLRRGSACVALLPLPDPGSAIRYHNGAHMAFNVSRQEFERARRDLPALLREHRAAADQSVEVEFSDYGLQWSLFFSDPDFNTLELTTWDVSPLAGRAGQGNDSAAPKAGLDCGLAAAAPRPQRLRAVERAPAANSTFIRGGF